MDAVASSQGDDTFSIYDRHLGRFRVAPGPHADGSEISDGAMVASASLGDAFPKGLLVVHDGTDAGGRRP